jgi:hypothetical protein
MATVVLPTPPFWLAMLTLVTGWPIYVAPWQRCNREMHGCESKQVEGLDVMNVGISHWRGEALGIGPVLRDWCL